MHQGPGPSVKDSAALERRPETAPGERFPLSPVHLCPSALFRPHCSGEGRGSRASRLIPLVNQTGDLAGPDRCLGTNPRTRPNPRRISDLPIEFRSSGRGFTQDLRAKNQCTAGGHQRVFIEMGHFEARLGPTAPVGGCATRFRAAFDRTARV